MASITALALSLFAITASATPQYDSDYYAYEIVTTTPGPISLPTGPVMAVTFPGGVDNQILIGSIVGAADALTTVAVSCPPGVDEYDCGFDPAVTLTAGPSTLHFSVTYDGSYTVDEACQWSEIGGECQVTAWGDEYYFITATDVDYETATGYTSSVSTSSFGANQLLTADVTLVAGQTAGLNIVSTATATGLSTESDDFSFETITSSHSSTRTSVSRASTSSHTGSASSSSSGSASAANSSTRTMNAAATLAPGAAGLGLMGLAALLL